MGHRSGRCSAESGAHARHTSQASHPSMSQKRAGDCGRTMREHAPRQGSGGKSPRSKASFDGESSPNRPPVTDRSPAACEEDLVGQSTGERLLDRGTGGGQGPAASWLYYCSISWVGRLGVNRPVTCCRLWACRFWESSCRDIVCLYDVICS